MTTLTDGTRLTDDTRVRAIASSHAQYFYFYMALSCMAVAFLGFAPTYWLPMASGTFPSMPVIHFHGLLFFAWTLYFAFQAWLAASGRIARHRAMGMIGVSLATAMTIFGFLAAVNTMKRAAAAGLTDAGIAFAIVPLSGILFFAVVFILAVSATPARNAQAIDASGRHLPSGRGSGALVSHLPGAAGTSRPSPRRGHHRSSPGRLSAARGPDRL
jgi:hypothetical protein